MQTYKSRMTLGINIENSLLKKQKIQKRFEDELFDIGVVLIITEDQNKFFSDKISMINLKNKDILLLFLRENEKKLFLDNCKPILKI